MRFLRLLLPLLILATGCKQQLGDRCQIDSDCAEGECGGNDICVPIGGGGTVFDAGPADAPSDANLDDLADAAPPVPDAPPAEPDAASPDAAEPDAA